MRQYVRTWKKRGYPDGIPDEVPDPLMKLGLAPSWKAIAVAILKNDMLLSSLGFGRPESKWYGAIKKIEIRNRPPNPEDLWDDCDWQGWNESISSMKNMKVRWFVIDD